MQIQYKNNGVIKHVSQEVGRGFIDAGLAVEILSTKPAPIPNLKWQVLPGNYIGDYQAPPVISHSCSTCGNKGWSKGPTIHLTLEIRHCGIVEKVPADISKKYVEKLKGYKGRSRRPENGNPSVDAIRDRVVAEHSGVKSREVLIADALAVAAKAKK